MANCALLALTEINNNIRYKLSDGTFPGGNNMKITKKRLTSFVLAMVMVLSLLPVGALSASAAQKSTTYVAIGDSASGGYGADGRFYGNYATILAEQTGYELTEDTMIFGTTNGILDRLESNANTQFLIEQAGLITVMLGVDDMMNVVYQAMADRYNASQSEHIFAGDVPDIVNGKGNYDKNVKMQLMISSMPLLNKGGTNYLIDSQLFKDAIRDFSRNLLAIAKEINELNPNATFLVATQYNPFTEYNGAKINLTLGSATLPFDLTSLYQCMEDGVTVLNEQIKNNASAGGYQVVDVKAAFEKEHSADNDLYVAAPGDSLATLSWDILPTEEGKKVMAAAFAAKTPDAPKYHNVSFDANGSSGTMPSREIEEGSFTLPVNEFTAPKGYEFAGWALSKDGKTISETSISVTADTTLYAIWKAQALRGDIIISGTMQVGSTLTASVSDTNNSGELTYQWYKGNTAIATGETYTLKAEDLNSTLYCIVSSSKQTGTLKSEETDKIRPKVFNDGEVDFQDYKGTYDGKSHTFTETVPAGITVEYSVDGSTFAAKKPEFKDAGAHTVSYRVTKTGFVSVTGTVQVVIERVKVTVKADAVSMAYGDKEPALTYKAEGLVGTEKLNGTLSRDPGTNVGTYPIKQGTLTNEKNPNYDIEFTGSNLTISKKAATYTVPSGLTAVYGQKLVEVKLPTGFSWQSPNSYVGDVGTNSFPAIYTPADQVNYESAALLVDVKVIEAPNNIQVDFDNKLGNVTGAGPYADGTAVKLTATPAAGAKFEYWVDASVDVTGKLTAAELKTKILSTEATYSFTADKDVHLVAVFSPEKIAIVPMQITGTDRKALMEAKRLNTKLDFGSIKPGDQKIELPGNLIKKEFTENEKQYKFAGILVAGHYLEGDNSGFQVMLKDKLIVDTMPLYGSAEYKAWLEPFAGGIYAAYVEDTSVTGEGNSKNPGTGDNSDLVIWLVILLFCVGGLAILSVTGRKKRKK